MADKKNHGSGEGIHEMESGLIHVADSLSGGPRGTYVDWFGAPASETASGSPSRDKGIAGKAPRLSTRFLDKK